MTWRSYAQDKLRRKGLDMIAANQVGEGLGFEAADNALSLYWADGQRELPRASKTELARQLIDMRRRALPGGARMIDVQLKILDPRLGDSIALPKRPPPAAPAWTCARRSTQPLTLAPGESALVPSGFAIHIGDPGWCALIVPRSGLGHKHGLVMGNLVGVIDADYQGPLMISCWNRGAQPVHHRGGRPHRAVAAGAGGAGAARGGQRVCTVGAGAGRVWFDRYQILIWRGRRHGLREGGKDGDANDGASATGCACCRWPAGTLLLLLGLFCAWQTWLIADEGHANDRVHQAQDEAVQAVASAVLDQQRRRCEQALDSIDPATDPERSRPVAAAALAPAPAAGAERSSSSAAAWTKCCMRTTASSATPRRPS